MRQGPTANEARQRELRRAEKGKERLLEDDLRAVALTPAGQRVFAWLIYSVCKVQEDPWTNQGSLKDRQLGRVSIGIDVLQKLRSIDRGFDLEIYKRRHEERTEDDLQQLAADAQGSREVDDAE